jgi:hypothetical protein
MWLDTRTSAFPERLGACTLQQLKGRLQALDARCADHLQVTERIADNTRRGTVLQRPPVFLQRRASNPARSPSSVQRG